MLLLGFGMPLFEHRFSCISEQPAAFRQTLYEAKKYGGVVLLWSAT
jgi:hypothetical protein